MALVTDDFHKKKLNKYGLNIKTNYIVGNKILERNTDNSVNDDIINGIRCEKKYYLKNKLIHVEKLFDSRIEYTFISKDNEKKDHTCINCGMRSKLSDFIDGCPYCKTYYNIDYIDKDLGTKYHYDLILRSNLYRIITAIFDLIVSFVIAFVYIKVTSRTFNGYDVSKIFIYGLILSFILYYFFYSLDAYIVLGPIKRYKERQNQKQIDFWNRTKIDKKKFFNNLNYEIRKYYYNKTNIIDYDIIDYIEFNEFYIENKLCVEVIADVRIVKFENNKIKSELIKDKFIIKRHENNVLNLKSGANKIECVNCGASIDVNKGKCEYCNNKISYLQEWILENK